MAEKALNFQHEKFCVNCRERYDESYFPFQNQLICLFCYEIEHNIILHKRRELLSLPKIEKKINRSIIHCPNCNSNSTRRARLKVNVNNEYFCKKCSLFWVHSR